MRDVGVLCRSYYELPEAAKVFIKLAKAVLDSLPPCNTQA